MSLLWISPGNQASVLETPSETPSRSSEPAEVSSPVGMKAWRAFYKDRMASHLIVMNANESSWQDDPVAVEEFRQLMEERLAAIALKPLDEATRERTEGMQQVAEGLIQEFHEMGILEGMASGTTRTLEPSAIATLANTLQTMRRKQDEDFSKDWSLDSSCLLWPDPHIPYNC